MSTDFDVDEIAQMFNDLDDLIMPDEGPPLPPLPVREEEEHIAPGRGHDELSIHGVLKQQEAIGARVEQLGGEIKGLKEDFAGDKVVTQKTFLAGGCRWMRE